MRCSRAQRLIGRAFVEQALPVPAARALWDHLRQCQSCRARYDRVLSLERLLEGQDPPALAPSGLELSLVEGLALSAAQPEPARADRPLGAGLLLRLGAALAAVAVAVLLGFLLWPRPDLFTFQARHAGQPGLGVRALCALTDVRGELLVRSLSADPGPQELASCPAQGRLSFAYVAPRPGYLFAWAGPDEAELRPLLPSSAAASAEQVPASARLQPTGVTLAPLDVAAEGQVVAVFVLSAAALDPGQRAQALRAVLRGEPVAGEQSAVILHIPIDPPARDGEHRGVERAP